MSNDFEFAPLEDYDDDDLRGMFDDEDDEDNFFDFDDDNSLDDDDEFDVFDDDEFDAQLDLIDGDDDDFDDDDDEFDDSAQESGNNSFGILMIMMGVLFVIGLGIILFIFFSQNAGQRAFNEESTAIAIINATSLAGIDETSTQSVLDQTATSEAAVAATDTAVAGTQSAMLTQSVQTATQAVVSLTETAEAIQQSTDDAIASMTQVVLDAQSAEVKGATETAVAIEMTLNPQVSDGFNGIPFVTLNGQPVLTATGAPVVIIDGEPFAVINGEAVGIVPGTPFQTADGIPVEISNGVPMQSGDGSGPMPTQGDSVPLSAVQQTATALQQLFAATPTPSGLLPTTDPGSGGGIATTVPGDVITVDPGSGGGSNEALPDTGLFDDIFGGNPMLLVLAAFALLAVIVVSRGIRSVNRSE